MLKAEDVLPVPTDEYATVVKGEDLDLNSGNKIYNIDVTSHDGTSHTNYKIVVEIGKSNNNYLESLTASVGELSPEFDTNETMYKLNLSQWEETVTINAIPQDEKAEIIAGLGTYTVQNGETKHVLVMCKAEDGSLRVYTVDIKRAPRTETRIMGKVITENVQNKHSAKVNLYIGNNIVKTVDTNEDGSYELHILPDTYKLVIEKPGYLTYTVEDIALKDPYDEANIGEYHLIAGDVVKTGEVEIDDLVALNDHFGIVIAEGEGIEDPYALYDLNEDKVIDKLDRNILKRNYSKMAEIIKWVTDNNQEEQSLKEDTAEVTSLEDKIPEEKTDEDVLETTEITKDTEEKEKKLELDLFKQLEENAYIRRKKEEETEEDIIPEPDKNTGFQGIIQGALFGRPSLYAFT